MELYKLPKIFTSSDKTNKRWYISYLYKSPDTNKFVRFVVWLSSKHKTKEDKLKAILDLKEYYSEKLKRGWSPFNQTNVKYTTLVEAFDYIIKIKTSTIRTRTLSTYKNVYSNFKEWLKKSNLLSVNIEQFNYKNAQAYFDYLKLDKGVNNRTYNNNLLQLGYKCRALWQ